MIDVGTDHAYLACYLVESGISERAVASDIADGPLNAARQTVERLGLGDRVTVLKSDGLKDLPTEFLSAATDVIIAGMGGELIAEILFHADRLSQSVNLILQPNSRVSVLRQYLAENGYNCVHESAVRDGHFVYTVIKAGFGGERHKLTPLESAVGLLDPRDPDSREYLIREAKKLRDAASGMSEALSLDRRLEAGALRALAEQIFEFSGN